MKDITSYVCEVVSVVIAVCVLVIAFSSPKLTQTEVFLKLIGM